jgi:hypothetical protein
VSAGDLLDKIQRMAWFLWLIGSMSILLAIFAHALGIDHTPDWGASRWFMLWAGLIITLAGCFWKWKKPISTWWHSTSFNHWFRSTTAGLFSSRPVSTLRESRVICWFSQPGETSVRWMALVTIVMGSLTAWWLVTAGTMNDFSHTTYYYDRLAGGFSHGQLSLLEEPDARLADLSNPYDYRERGEIPVIWDASYYQGRYYLYWGPVPALLICVIKPFTSLPVGDLSLVLFFVIGCMAVQTWLLVLIHRRWFAHLPAGLAIPPLLAGTFCVTLLWQLPRPSIYEAAITGGQFFWLLSLTFIFLGFDSEKGRVGRLILAGLCLAAAIGCRANLLVQTAALLTCLLYLYFRRPAWRRDLFFGGATFALGMAVLGWYNLARFGSILETGYSYQFTGPAAISLVGGTLYSPGFMLPNFYNAFLRPPLLDTEFPFIHSPWITEAMWPFFIHLPEKYYYSEPISGLLFTCPFLIFFPAAFARKHRSPEVIGLGVVAFVSILVNLAFITTFMRYLLDFSPLLILLAAIGFWQLNGKPSPARGFLGLVLGITAAMIGILLAIAGPNNNILNSNPALFQWLAGLFQ